MDWNFIFSEIFLSIFDFLSFLFFLRCQLNFNYRFRKSVHFMLCALICGISFYLTVFFDNFTINPIIILLCLFLYISLFFTNNIKQKIICFILYIIILMFSEIIAIYFTMFYTNNNIILSSLTIEEKVLGYIFSRLILILILLIIKKFEFDIKKSFYLRYWCFFMITSAITILFAFLYFNSIFNENGNNESIKFFLAIFLFVFILYSLVFYLYYRLVYYINKESEKDMIKYQLDLMERYMAQKIESEQNIKQCYHDIKNIVIYWENIAINTHNDILLDSVKRYENYIKKHKIIDVGNTAANAIISEKYNIAQKYEVKFDVSGAFMDAIVIDEIEISILLGNILDNAIEATVKVDEASKRFIKIMIKNRDKFCFIEVQNSYKYKPKVKNNKLISSKKSDLPHGIGFYCSKKITEKYNGSIQYQFESNIFKVFIMLRCYW